MNTGFAFGASRFVSLLSFLDGKVLQIIGSLVFSGVWDIHYCLLLCLMVVHERNGCQDCVKNKNIHEEHGYAYTTSSTRSIRKGSGKGALRLS